MDLCADQLVSHLPDWVQPIKFSSSYHRVASRAGLLHKASRNLDRLINRHWTLPGCARRLSSHADCVHIVDHSYSHLSMSFPRAPVGIYCHDIDAFRCILQPDKDPRPRWFREIAFRILKGLKRAAIVFHSTSEVRDSLVQMIGIPPQRLVHAPYGVADEFTPFDQSDSSSESTVGGSYLLHVGSDIPRKRLDFLLKTFAAIHLQRPNMRLVQVGPAWSKDRLKQIDRLGINEAVIKLTGISRLHLASLYRGAAVVVVPSDSEGFGLPVIEALACGAIVVASDIPVLREVGGLAVKYCSVGATHEWVQTILDILSNPDIIPRIEFRLNWVKRYSWEQHAHTIAEAYRSRCTSVS